MKATECFNILKTYFSDEEIKKIVFNEDYQEEDIFLTSSDKILTYFSNIMNLAYAFLFGRYRQWYQYDGEIKIVENQNVHNFMRIITNFGKVYSERQLTYSLIEDLIMDTQIDIALHGPIASEFKIKNDFLDDEYHEFAFFAYKARQARSSSRIDPCVIDQRLNELIGLLKLFPFISKIKVNKTPIENAYHKINGEMVPFKKLSNVSFEYIDKNSFNYFIKEDEFVDYNNIDTYYTFICIGNEYYFLNDINFESNREDNKNNILLLSYLKVGDLSKSKQIFICNDKIIDNHDNLISIKEDGGLETYIMAITPNYTGGSSSKSGFKDFYSINYKYIKKLSLAISDTIDETIKKELYDKYYNDYPYAFQENKLEDLIHKDVHWDTIIAILLVEVSAINVLATIFSISNNTFILILNNLQSRFGLDRFASEKVLNSAKEQTEISEANWKNHYFGRKLILSKAISNKAEEECRHIKAEVHSRALVSALSKAIYDNDNFEEKVRFPVNIKSHINMLKELEESNSDLKFRKENLKNIIFQVLRILICFYEGFFGYAKIKNKFENDSLYTCFSQKEIAKIQKSANDSFITKFHSAFDKYDNGDISITEILNDLADLANICAYKKGKGTLNQILKESLGKDKLLDMKKIQYLSFNIDSIESNDELSERIYDVIKIFKYLQTGSNGSGAIYPYVATYEYSNQTRDGYSISHFSIVFDKNVEKDVKVLSEFKYQINEKYYCLPNSLRYNEKLNIWIEPIMINCRNLDMKEDKEKN